MNFKALLIGIVLGVVVACCAAAQQEPFPSRAYGYVTTDATYSSNMFYALAGDESLNSTQRGMLPLVIYLQGGPGASSLFGDLLENGPEKLEVSDTAPYYKLTKRVHSWTKHANMLWIDNPIGTGFSYTKDKRGYATTDDQIASALVLFMKGFYTQRPEYKGNALWIFCESYGGKMTAYFGAALQKAIKAGEVPATNYKGVAIGDGWVDPVQCMKSYGTYLHGLSLVTDDQRKNATMYADWAQDALERGAGREATNWWSVQQGFLSSYTAGANWYNILYYYDYTADYDIGPYVRQNLTKQLGSLIPPNVTYHMSSGPVFEHLEGTFMVDGVHQVQEMIDAGLSVNVYGGQVDLIVDTLCIQGWMRKLQWTHIKEFLAQPRSVFYAADSSSLNVGGYIQRFKNLAFYQINKAGHMVPLDQPAVAETMFVKIIGGDMKKVDPKDYNPVPPKGKEGVIHMRRHHAIKKP